MPIDRGMTTKREFIQKGNPYHDKEGKFTDGGGGSNTMSVSGGSTIHEAARDALDIADASKKPTNFKFNGVDMVAHPGEAHADIVSRFKSPGDKASEAAGWKKTPKGWEKNGRVNPSSDIRDVGSQSSVDGAKDTFGSKRSF
jgi:hypothetical protein